MQGMLKFLLVGSVLLGASAAPSVRARSSDEHRSLDAGQGTPARFRAVSGTGNPKCSTMTNEKCAALNAGKMPMHDETKADTTCAAAECTGPECCRKKTWKEYGLDKIKSKIVQLVDAKKGDKESFLPFISRIAGSCMFDDLAKAPEYDMIGNGAMLLETIGKHLEKLVLHPQMAASQTEGEDGEPTKSGLRVSLVLEAANAYVSRTKDDDLKDVVAALQLMYRDEVCKAYMTEAKYAEFSGTPSGDAEWNARYQNNECSGGGYVDRRELCCEADKGKEFPTETTFVLSNLLAAIGRLLVKYVGGDYANANEAFAKSILKANKKLGGSGYTWYLGRVKEADKTALEEAIGTKLNAAKAAVSAIEAKVAAYGAGPIDPKAKTPQPAVPLKTFSADLYMNQTKGSAWTDWITHFKGKAEMETMKKIIDMASLKDDAGKPLSKAYFARLVGGLAFPNKLGMDPDYDMITNGARLVEKLGINMRTRLKGEPITKPPGSVEVLLHITGFFLGLHKADAYEGAYISAVIRLLSEDMVCKAYVGKLPADIQAKMKCAGAEGKLVKDLVSKGITTDDCCTPESLTATIVSTQFVQAVGRLLNTVAAGDFKTMGEASTWATTKANKKLEGIKYYTARVGSWGSGACIGRCQSGPPAAYKACLGDCKTARTKKTEVDELVDAAVTAVKALGDATAAHFKKKGDPTLKTYNVETGELS